MHELVLGLPAQTKTLESSVDWLTEVVHRFSDAYTERKPLGDVDMNTDKRPVKVSAKDSPHMKVNDRIFLQWKAKDCHYIDKEWTPAEIAAFEDGIALHGPELRAIREEIQTRSHAEVVRYYGHWKKYDILDFIILKAHPCE